MTIKKMTCINCPRGCTLMVEVENGYVLKVAGNMCPIGEKYAKQEVEHPMRVLTSAVLAEGLDLKMIPVKTNKPIPKEKILPAMELVKNLRVSRPLTHGAILIANILDTEADLIATRSVLKNSGPD